MLRRPFLALLALTACVGPQATTGAPSTGSLVAVHHPMEGTFSSDTSADPIVEGQFIVRASDLEDPGVQQMLEDLSAEDLQPIAGIPDTFTFSSPLPEAQVGLLAAASPVVYVEPVVRVFPYATAPQDAYFAFQWHHESLGTLEAWDTGRGAGVVVAIVDTGLHDPAALPDAPVHVLPGLDIVPSAVDGILDDVGHGTHIASIIAQNADNSVGGAGIAPDVSILPVRALGREGGTSDDVAQGIRWATDQGADIINLSLGGPVYSQVIADACQYAYDNGVLIFAASGNEYASHHVSYPAALDTTVAVGASGPDLIVADYSNRGGELDLVAPGGILYDYNRDGMIDGILAETALEYVGVPGMEDGWYVGGFFMVGTSMATGVASASAAVLMGAGADRETTLEILRGTALDGGAEGWDPEYGDGIVDLSAALAAWNEIAPPPVIGVADAAPGDFVVTEFMANPSSCANDTCEWFEVENAAHAAIDLLGLRFVDEGGNEGVVDGSVVVQPGERVVLGRGAAADWAGPPFTPAGFYGSVALNNTGDRITLANDTVAIARTAAYGSALAKSGVSAELVGADPEDLAAWALATADMGNGELGTPGY